MVSEQLDHGLREIDPADGRAVGVEYWNASRILPTELLKALPGPPVGVAG